MSERQLKLFQGAGRGRNPSGGSELRGGRRRGRPRKHRTLSEKEWANAEARNLRKYGISTAGVLELLAKQDGRCLICQERFPAKGRGRLPVRCWVDHVDTPAGPVVRGLLCRGCNCALGLFRDSPAILERARRYLIERGSAANPLRVIV